MKNRLVLFFYSNYVITVIIDELLTEIQNYEINPRFIHKTSNLTRLKRSNVL